MAGVSTKEIKNRIRSMESTKQITKAMEMVAASKLRRAQAQITNSRPYFEIIYSVIQDIAHSENDRKLPFLSPVKDADPKTVYIVIAGDRGLAGGYNNNILKMCWSEMDGKEVAVLPVGRKAFDFFRVKEPTVLSDHYVEAEDISISDCFSIAKKLCKSFQLGRYSELRIGYTDFVSVLSQTPRTLRLLPLDASEVSKGTVHTEITYEPNGADVFESIVPEYLGGVIYGALCESRAAEQAARRTAMDSATQNADDMITELNLRYNRARQAAITQEITEIIAGT